MVIASPEPPRGVIDGRVGNQHVGDERIIAEPARLQEILQPRRFQVEIVDHTPGGL